LAAVVVLILVPQIKYPANPPSVGNPDTWNATLVGGTAYIAVMVAAIYAAAHQDKAAAGAKRRQRR
jgi:hypothetical protein